jgi:ADP-ribosyl-[dinitrogen reductase] hydrolase
VDAPLPNLRDVRERARAALLGVALGDALGATVEFLTRSEIQAQHGVHRDIVGGGWLHLRPGAVTDDTEMSLCLARAAVAAGGWSRRGAAEQLAAWLRGRPSDVGSTSRRGIRAFILDGTLEVPPSAWDAGNGAAMRMAPVALLTLADRERLERCAVEQAHLTHNHPLSDAACVLVGSLVHLGVLGLPRELLGRRAARLVEAFPAFRYEPYRGLASGYVVDTLQTVLHHFFYTPSFEECLVATVNRGGDADTAGAIAGAIAGAHYGPAALPRRWLKKLDRGLVAELTWLADRLVDLSPLGRGEPPAL